ncbi:hypothetical protein PIB30_083641 [Stylosanthes scabra]|uniref:Uncharacterized protein n=1 Tax=Stylosanthes scabra TaxID=79078 RepID=A0ABU6XQP0_9FABA|nr:hypothetical protein [Stylosanthes scabra]
MGTEAETPITCGLCGGPHENHHCCLIREDQPMKQAIYMGNQPRHPYHDPNANTYNPGWRNHPHLGECKAVTVRSGKALEDVNNKVNVQTTKGDDKAIPYPKEEDAKGYMRIDVIEELIMEVQEEEAM